MSDYSTLINSIILFRNNTEEVGIKLKGFYYINRLRIYVSIEY